MGRELDGYRDQLEDILTFFDGRRLLTVTDVAIYLGRQRNCVRERFGIGKEGITAPMLARKLAALGR